MKIARSLTVVGVVSAIQKQRAGHPCFLGPYTRTGRAGSFPPFVLWSNGENGEGNEPEPLLSEEDIRNINEYVADVRAGAYGEERKREFERLEVEEAAELDASDLKKILETRNDKFERDMNQVFDLSNIQPEDGKEIDWEDLERRVADQGRREGLDPKELKSIVNSLYRKSGLLSEPFKTVEVSGLELNWRQSLKHLEIWFKVDPGTKKRDYELKFLPSTLTIAREGQTVLEKTLSGKVDCDGCFWTMYKNPATGAKYININLAKRAPNHTNMWDRPFT